MDVLFTAWHHDKKVSEAAEVELWSNEKPATCVSDWLSSEEAFKDLGTPQCLLSHRTVPPTPNLSNIEIEGISLTFVIISIICMK